MSEPVYLSRVAAAQDEYIRKLREMGVSEEYIEAFDEHSGEVLAREWSLLWGMPLQGDHLSTSATVHQRHGQQNRQRRG